MKKNHSNTRLPIVSEHCKAVREDIACCTPNTRTRVRNYCARGRLQLAQLAHDT